MYMRKLKLVVTKLTNLTMGNICDANYLPREETDIVPMSITEPDDLQAVQLLCARFIHLVFPVRTDTKPRFSFLMSGYSILG